jgi:hypothetical protein
LAAVAQELMGKGLTMVTVMIMLQRLVLVGKMLFLVDRYLRLLIMALVLVLMCGAL